MPGMLAHLRSAVRSFVAPVLRDRRGASAVFLAVSLIPMVGAVGLAIDSSLGYLLKARLSKSLDAAGLAAGRKALDDDAEAIALAYFNANFGEDLGDIHLESFDFELDDEQRHVTLSAEATTPTYFMRVFGHEQMTVSARTVIERQTTGMELALVLDNTGSMFGTNFNAMQAAAYDLIEVIYGEETEIDNVWVSLVPYTATVNIGPSRTGWLNATDRVFTNPASFRPDLTGGGWKGCVMAQPMPYDADDTPISAQKLTSFFYPATSSTTDNNWPPIKPNQVYNDASGNPSVNLSRGPNLGCGPAITPLTSSRATIDAAIGNMAAWGRGGTTGNLGLTWGWRTISPRWRGLWGDADLPLDYGTDFMDKVVVILTDGKNQFHDNDSSGPPSDFTAYGRVNAPGPVGLAASTVAAGRTILDTRMAGTCSAMKAEHIRIYTITFGGTPDATAQTLFRNCASSPSMYYHAPDPDDIADVFRAIGGQLANLLIIE
jgi:Flp pilus assembly protein TadG